jgi:nucleoside-diphosphate-sugar epimerase
VRVTLTGGNGFVGSHVLDELLRRGHEVTLLLRTTSDTAFIAEALGHAKVVYGSLQAADSLAPAVRDAEAVIHCAGLTKALRRRDYYRINTRGTEDLIGACNSRAAALGRFILVSSQAVSGPGTSREPAREEGPPRPVTPYGRSKMLAEEAVRKGCRAPFTILRPAAVYGPRDRDFLVAFRAVRRGLAPLIKGGRQRLCSIYVADLVEGVMKALERPDAGQGPYHLAHPMPLRQREMLEDISAAVGRAPRYVRVPGLLLYPTFAAQGLLSRITGRPSVMSLHRVPEYVAPGWVCSTARAAEELGFAARIAFPEGARQTFAWYVEQGWLKEAPQ